GAEDALERPLLMRKFDGFRARGASGRDEDGDDGERQLAHHAFSIGLAGAGAAAKPPPFSTGSLMLCGQGSGRSNTLNSGSRTMKWKKYQAVAMRAMTT